LYSIVNKGDSYKGQYKLLVSCLNDVTTSAQYSDGYLVQSSLKLVACYYILCEVLYWLSCSHSVVNVEQTNLKECACSFLMFAGFHVHDVDVFRYAVGL